jgi:putative ABC transport system permease protein
MRLGDQLRSVRHTFAANRMRAALTLLGIMIGSGSIVLLAGLLRGGEEALVATSQRADEADLVQVRRDDAPQAQAQRTRRELNRGDADSLDDSRLLDGAQVASESAKESRAYFHQKKKRVRLVGAAPVSLSLNRLQVARGRAFEQRDLDERRRVCVIGWEVWTELLESRPDATSLELTIEGTAWTIIGVLKDKPPLGGGGGGDGTWMWNRRVLVPQTTFDALFAPSHETQRIYVRLRGTGPLAQRIRAVEGVVSGTLLRRHLGVQNFKVEGEESHANQEHMILAIIKMLLLGTGLLSLFVGGINIMNIMLVTVTERTREIGIRRAIGAPPSSILAQFLLEAVLIASTGGLIGVGGGVLLSWLATLGLAHAFGEWRLHVEAWAILLGLSLSLSTGAIFGLFPAWRAARLDPVEALRYE